MMRHMIVPALLLGVVGCAHAPRETPRDPDISAMVKQVDAARIATTVRELASFQTRHTLSDPDSSASGIGAAREWIRAQFEQYAKDSGGRLRAEFQEVRITKPIERVPHPPVTVINVLATLPGRRTGAQPRVCIVSGHYDSRNLDVMDAAGAAPGANDDASGVAAVLEMARVMSRHEFDATIVFAAVAGEEQGLLGAAGLAERAKNEGWDVAAMFTNDIVGNTTGGNGVHDAGRVRVFAEGVPTAESALQIQERQSVGGENDSPSRQLARYIKDTAGQYVKNFDVKLVWRRDRYSRGGDHIPFLRQGYPAVRFTEPNEDYSRQHQNVTTRNGRPYGDVTEFVDFKYVANVARVNLAAIASIARAPASPRNVRLDAGLGYDTVLTWDRAADDDQVAGYAVLVRDTTAPLWQRRIDVGNVSTATLKNVSKDDWMFGVEAYDKGGHRSVPRFPVPARARGTGASTRTTAATTGPAAR